MDSRVSRASISEPAISARQRPEKSSTEQSSTERYRRLTTGISLIFAIFIQIWNDVIAIFYECKYV